MSIVSDLISEVTSVVSLVGGPVAKWSDQLRVASFRGLSFGVLDAESRFGRRLALHEYPYRDKPYIEDLGRATRKISFRAFLVENDAIFNGGAVIVQKERLIAACEQADSGTLVHPTLGRLTVTVAEDGLTIRERWDQGRYFELGLSFIESGERVFPDLLVATNEAVVQAAVDADGAAAASFAARAGNDLKQGAAVVNQAASTAATWARTAQRLGNDATNLKGLVSTLTGSFGRYSGGKNFSGFTGITSGVIGTSTTIRSLIDQGTVSRNQISLASSQLGSATTGLGL